MNNVYSNNQYQPSPVIKLGAIALGIYMLDSLFNSYNDTLNYTLWYKNKLVYHGVCYADRMKARLDEHALRGIVYDEFDHDRPKSRAKALLLERKLIQKDKPKYNIHHNY
jgi:hypothetical protein